MHIRLNKLRFVSCKSMLARLLESHLGGVAPWIRSTHVQPTAVASRSFHKQRAPALQPAVR